MTTSGNVLPVPPTTVLWISRYLLTKCVSNSKRVIQSFLHKVRIVGVGLSCLDRFGASDRRHDGVGESRQWEVPQFHSSTVPLVIDEGSPLSSESEVNFGNACNHRFQSYFK